MRLVNRTVHNHLLSAIVYFAALAPLFSSASRGQDTPYERTFPQSKIAVEKAVRDLKSSTAGHLPVLDGFAVSGDSPLDRFQHAYYQCTVRVSSTPSGGALVRVSAKITAWYADTEASKSGYRVLASNGRLESDFLERLADTLRERTASGSANPPSKPAPPKAGSRDASAPTLSAPMPRGTDVDLHFKLGPGVSSATQPANADQHTEELSREAKSLEEILRNQSHPNNLVAVRKSGTPVFVSPSEGAKVMFFAAAEDEYEILDTNASWVHVRISGLSRGWILRSNLEMPEASPTETAPAEIAPVSQPAAAGKLGFRIKDEQVASFPADWEPLRGRTVKIISLQKTGERTADTGSQAKLAFAKSLLDKEYVELTQSSSTAAGVVVIFDSSDGGMLAATMPVLQQWKAGTLSDEALWRRCYFDPPELFGSANH